MGRYDKIKVYKNGSWVRPNRIRAYLNGWVDLGLNDSTNTRSLKVRKNNNFIRATLNRRDYSYTVGEEYAYGPFDLYPSSAYCYNPSKCSWGFYMKVMKESAGTKNLLDIHNIHGTEDPYFKIIWREDGHIEIKNKYTGYSETSLVSNHSYGTGQYISVNVYATKNNRNVVLEILGHESKSKYLGGAFSNTGSVTKVGDWGLRYIEGFTCYGAAYNTNTNGRVEFTITDQYGANNQHSTIYQSDKRTESGTVWE